MNATLRTALWALVAIVPLAIGGLVLARWEWAAAVEAAEDASDRSATNVALAVELTTAAALRQLEAFAASPELVEATIERDGSRLRAELLRFRNDPSWRAVAVVDADGNVIASSGAVRRSDFEAAVPSGVTVVPRIGVQPARAVVSVPIVSGRSERGRLIGTYHINLIAQALSISRDRGMILLLRSDGTVLLGPIAGMQARDRVQFEAGGTRARLGEETYTAAVVPVLGGNAHVVSLQAPSEFGGNIGIALATIGLSMLATAAAIVVARTRLSAAEARLARQQREMTALQDLATDSAVSTSRDQILRMAGARIAESIRGVDASWVALRIDDARVQVHPTFPKPRPPVELPIAGNLLLARVLQHGQRESGRANRQDRAWSEAGFSSRCLQIWTPLVAHGRILGVIGIAYEGESAAISAEELRLLDGLAATLAVSLESWNRLAALAHERAVLATIVAATPDGLLALDGENRILFDNPAARELLIADRPLVGATWEEAIAGMRSRATLAFAKDFGRMLEDARAGTTTRSSFRIEMKGEVRSLESVIAPLPLPDGGSGSLVSIRDVSERAELAEVRRLHQEVSRLARDATSRAALLEQVLAASDLGLVFLDVTGKVDYANERFGELLGIERPAPGLQETALLAKVRTRLADEISNLREAKVVHTIGPSPRTLAFHAAPVHDPEGRMLGCLISVRDETAQRELDEAREAFIGVAAHELKNPIAVLRLNAEMGLRDPARAREALERIVARSTDLQELIERLLDATRAELGRLPIEPVSVPVMACARAAAEPWLGKVDLEIVGDPDVHVCADPVRLRQVISNLLSNAVRHAGQGRIELAVAESGGWARIAVHDEGPGIPTEEQVHIFDRFAQGRVGTKGQGLGIGLYLSQRIVEAHGGRIDLQSAPGVGSTFTVLLPAIPRPPPATAYGAGTQPAA